MNNIPLTIRPNGEVQYLYTEEVDLHSLGPARNIRRASTVEPNEHGEWQADLSLSGGPVLGPFLRRSQALEAEAEWIREHILKRTKH